jgi:hypothetical protein
MSLVTDYYRDGSVVSESCQALPAVTCRDNAALQRLKTEGRFLV